MFDKTMRSKGYIEIQLHIDYVSAYDHEPVTDEVQML